jgi:outer membrane protein
VSLWLRFRFIACTLALSAPLAAQQPSDSSGQGATQQVDSRTGTRQAQMPSGQMLRAQGGLVGGTSTVRTGTLTTVNGAPQVPGAARVTQGPAALSLEQAIQLAIQNNLTTLLAEERRREAEGIRQETRAGLLPNISGTAYQANVTQNLAALGFQPGVIPGFRTFVGPFNNFDARARLVQTIFDLSALRNYRAGRAGVRVAELQTTLAREQVASFTALTYLEALRAERAVSAAAANVTLAETLVTLATDQRNAGVATGVDVTRAQVRLAEEQVRLAQAQTDAEQSRLNLQRIIGVALGGDLTLTDPLRFTDEQPPTVESLIAQAAATRPEVRIAEAELERSELERKAVRAEQYPSLDFVGDYGVSGITPTDTALPTRRAAVQLNVPIFNGGLTRGRLAVAASRAR